jgi:hypothetical protein
MRKRREEEGGRGKKITVWMSYMSFKGKEMLDKELGTMWAKSWDTMWTESLEQMERRVETNGK